MTSLLVVHSYYALASRRKFSLFVFFLLPKYFSCKSNEDMEVQIMWTTNIYHPSDRLDVRNMISEFDEI